MTQPHTPFDDSQDFTETRIHILTAGRELLLAAKGALQFCSKYVESSQVSAPHVKAFFKKAINVADDLSSGLRSADMIKRAASSAVKPIFTALEQELAADAKRSTTAGDTARTTAKRATKRAAK